MIREIVRDPVTLRRKSIEATETDVQVATDLVDTLQANLDQYSGMAACMIREHKQILAIQGIHGFSCV